MEIQYYKYDEAKRWPRLYDYGWSMKIKEHTNVKCLDEFSRPHFRQRALWSVWPRRPRVRHIYPAQRFSKRNSRPNLSFAVALWQNPWNALVWMIGLWRVGIPSNASLGCAVYTPRPKRALSDTALINALASAKQCQRACWLFVPYLLHRYRPGKSERVYIYFRTARSELRGEEVGSFDRHTLPNHRSRLPFATFFDIDTHIFIYMAFHFEQINSETRALSWKGKMKFSQKKKNWKKKPEPKMSICERYI